MITSILGARVPIWQAPVGSIAGQELATAVARAGGVGALALTWVSSQEAHKLVASVTAATDGTFQGNFVLAFDPISLTGALEAGLRIVTFSWGMPHEQAHIVKSFGAKFGIQVTGRESARQALDLGADFLVCQGVEAGGHVQATRSLWQVLPEIVAEAGSVPVIAAGGIASGSGIARALANGASGAMLGTRFVATIESLAHESYKRRIVAAQSMDAVLTVCFDLGWPYAAHRVLRNSTVAMWEAAGCPPSGRRPFEGEVIARLANGKEFVRYEDTPPRLDMSGVVEAMSLYAGTGCGEIQDIPSASELVERLWKECQAHKPAADG
jgi:nitronate monooxygenase